MIRKHRKQTEWSDRWDLPPKWARLESAAAQESLKVESILFEGGRIGARELENARLRAHEKTLGAFDAERALWQNQVELLRATGSFASLF